jgi:hypothetical protein
VESEYVTLEETARLVERFLEKNGIYPQEWNDFVETPQRDGTVETYRKRCYELDPLVNRPGEPDPRAVADLLSIVKALSPERTQQ